jgi:glycosyltransferase involved in cell wall biosynthesis
MHMPRGLVTVMMPAYNAAGFIGEAIDSLLAQSYANWELIVVNDGSTDSTADIVGRYRDPRIRLITQPNGGESSARNTALDHARGEFLAYLDADDAYLPHHLSVTVGFLEANPTRDAVYTDGIHIDEHGRRLTTLQSRRRGPFVGRLYEELVRASDVFGPPMCVVLRRELVVRHGLRYDTRIVIGPDWDFFVRLGEHATFGYIDDQTGLYRVHQSNITVQVDQRRRAGYLAICRENAINAAAFGTCPVETCAAVFYDLLVKLLRGQPERRMAATRWPAFAALPPAEQARLLRLMATSAIVDDRDSRFVGEWLQRAAALNRRDARASMLDAAYRISPGLGLALLGALDKLRGRRVEEAPFADLHRAARAAGGGRS